MALPDTNTNYAMWLWKYPKTGLCFSLAKHSWPGMSAMSHGRCSTSQRLSQPWRFRAESPISCEGVLQELVDDHLRHRSRSVLGLKKWETKETNSWGFGNPSQWHPVTMAISSAAKWRQVRSRKPMHTRQVEFQILGPASITKWGAAFSDRAPNLQESLSQTPSLSRNQVECIRPPSRRAYIKDISIQFNSYNLCFASLSKPEGRNILKT